MAYISFQPKDHYNTKLYTGNSSTQSITGVGFTPDWTWLKKRNSTSNHSLVQSILAISKVLYSNDSHMGGTDTDALTSFNADGFSLGNSSGTNNNSDTYASWNWKGGGTGVANTVGTIASTTSVNTTSGFSIVTWSGTGATGTVGHGLGIEPQIVLVKSTSAAQHWIMYNKNLGNASRLILNLTIAAQTSITEWNSTTPTSSVFSVINDDGVNGSSNTYIAYCFADIKGYQKIGTYEGNGNADGTFIYTGFKPAFVLIKNADAVEAWNIYDNKRSASNGSNEVGYCLLPNSNVAEQAHTASTGKQIDILSNGFKLRGSGTEHNGNNNTHIYLAIADKPLVSSNGIPCTAR